MVKHVKHIPPIEDTITKDGPIMKVLAMPQLMYVKHTDYGLKKLYKRLNNLK